MGYPLAALAVKPPQQTYDPLEQYGRALQIRQLMQNAPLQQQALQQENQIRGLQIQQQQAMNTAWAGAFKDDGSIDADAVVKKLGEAGGGASVPAVSKALNDLSEQRAKLQEYKDKHAQAENEYMGAMGAAIKAGTPSDLLFEQANRDGYGQAVQQAQAALQRGMTTEQLGDALIAHSAKTQEAQAATVAAKARMAAATKPPQGDEKLTDAELAQANSMLPKNAQLQPGATKSDAQRVISLSEFGQRAQETQAQRGITNALAQSHLDLARNQESDKSYQFNSNQLENIAKPVDAIASRLSRLTDTMAQHNPQADALIAPELLSVMSGGQGSGLRMNEAEISRIIGGRSAWENLKASIQHWSTNPQDARSITPAQDQQIHQLVGLVQSKVNAKQGAIQDARQALLGTNNVNQHRQIVADARQKLDQVDSGATVKMKAPNGQVKEVPADQVVHYKTLGAVEVK